MCDITLKTIICIHSNESKQRTKHTQVNSGAGRIDNFGGAKCRGVRGHPLPEHFKISYLLECYFLNFLEQLKMYFTKKIALSFRKSIFEEYKIAMLNMDKIFSIRATNVFHVSSACLLYTWRVKVCVFILYVYRLVSALSLSLPLWPAYLLRVRLR